MTSKNFGKEGVPQMKKVFAVACTALFTGVGAALLAGKDDVRRFRRMHKM